MNNHLQSPYKYPKNILIPKTLHTSSFPHDGIILVAGLLGMLPAILTGRIFDGRFIGGDFNQLITLIGASFIVLLLTGLIGFT